MAGYKSVPDHIIEEIQALDGEDFKIGVSRVAAMEALDVGKMKRLGVSTSGEDIEVTSPLLPDGPGRWANWNRKGRVIPRPDWPKQTRTWTTTSPNFGDAGRYGYSSQMHSRDKQATQTLHGKAFAFDVAAKKRPDGKVVVDFMLEPVFAASVDLDSPDLLMAVSLTREVVGTPRVFSANARCTDWQNSQNFDWEFLPVDHTGAAPDYDVVADTLGIPRNSSMRDTFQDRYSQIREMEPISIRYGNTGFVRYVAFEFDNAVVLENYYYGNAAYVMYEDWEALSKRTRLDLLADPSARFERVTHSKDWKAKLTEAVKGQRGLA